MAWVGGGVTSLFSALMISILSTSSSIVSQVINISTSGLDTNETLQVLSIPTTEIDTNETLHDSVRWVPLQFSPCSPPCEGFHPCNSPLCTAQWRLGNWSECSATCGVGTQTRHTQCVSLLHGSIVSPKDCPLPVPESSQSCHKTTCPIDEDDVRILSQNYKLTQLRRAKKMTLVVGGEVKLFPGQNIVVKCPVKNFPRKAVNWSRNYRLVKLVGRVKSHMGQLHITNADPREDAGNYTCEANRKFFASINIQFLSEQDAASSKYKNWIQSKVHLQKLPSSKSSSEEGQGQLVKSTSPVDVDQQRDQSRNDSSGPMYVPGDWSDCPAACEMKGQINRTVSCAYVTRTFVKVVPDEECQKTGLLKPDTTATCGQDCAVWKTGPWSKCHGQRCGHPGKKTRPVTCIWKSTGQVATGSCLMDKKPKSSKSCKFRCVQGKAGCKDTTKSCVLAGRLKMCRYQSFRQNCCATCHRRSNSVS